MATNKSRFVCLFLLAALFSAFKPGTVRELVQQSYTREIGIREATGKNDGTRVEEYLRAVKLKAGNPWCAAFVSWCYQQQCVKNPASGWSPAWFQTNMVYTRDGKHKGTPAPASVFGIWFPEKKRIAHVGFIDHWGEEWVTTVEGNTNEAGSREGDGVYKKKRLRRQIYAVADYIN